MVFSSRPFLMWTICCTFARLQDCSKYTHRKVQPTNPKFQTCLATEQLIFFSSALQLEHCIQMLLTESCWFPSDIGHRADISVQFTEAFQEITDLLSDCIICTCFVFLYEDRPISTLLPSLQVCLSFNPQSTLIATGSMDSTAKLWDVQTGQERETFSVSEHWMLHEATFFTAGKICCGQNLIVPISPVHLQGHSAEIISLGFNTTGTQLITGSFDHTVSVWDVNSGKWVARNSLHMQIYKNQSEVKAIKNEQQPTC